MRLAAAALWVAVGVAAGALWARADEAAKTGEIKAGQAGAANAGAANAGAAKSGAAKSGAAKSGAAKSGAAESGAANAGAAKSGAAKSGAANAGAASAGAANAGAAKAGAASRAAEKAVPRIWWSFPNDDETAIEVDDADLDTEGGERFDTRSKFAIAMQKCNYKRSKVLAQHKDGTPVREIRLESTGADGKSSSTRCVMTLKDWRARIGKDLVYRLDDELDAHASFLMPRRRPGMPARMGLSPDMGPPDMGAP